MKETDRIAIDHIIEELGQAEEAPVMFDDCMRFLHSCYETPPVQYVTELQAALCNLALNLHNAVDEKEVLLAEFKEQVQKHY